MSKIKTFMNTKDKSNLLKRKIKKTLKPSQKEVPNIVKKENIIYTTNTKGPTLPFKEEVQKNNKSTSNNDVDNGVNIEKSNIDTTNTVVSKNILKSTLKNLNKSKLNLQGFQINLSNNLENKNITELCKGLYEFIPLVNRFNFDKTNVSDNLFHVNQTCFEMVITKENVSFNILTKSDINKFKNLYNRYYPDCVLKDLDIEELSVATKEDLVIEYDLKEPYFKSLSIDCTHMQPIASFMDLQLILHEDEKIIQNFILTPASPDWGTAAEENKKSYKNNEQELIKIPNKINFNSVSKIGINLLGVGMTTAVNGINELLFDKPEEIKLGKNKTPSFTNATNQKSNYTAFNTTVRSVIHAKDLNRKNIIKHMIDNAFSFMDSDNSLAPTIINKKEKTFYAENKKEFIDRVNKREPSLSLTSKNILTVKEIGKLMLLPTKSIQDKYLIDKTVKGTNTNTLPPELLEGNISTGYSVPDSKKVTLPKDPDLFCLPKIVSGGMGSGKSAFSVYYCIQCIRNNITMFVFDYIDECVTSKLLREALPKEDVIVIKPEQMLNFSYPEISKNSKKSHVDQGLNFANSMIELLDTINTGALQDMTARMKKIFRGAAYVAYASSNCISNLKSAYRILTEIDFRNMAIAGIPKDELENFQVGTYLKFINALTIVNRQKEEVNDDDSIKFLLDRFDILMADENLYKIFDNEEDKVDFTELINSHKVVTIEMPEDDYLYKWVKDVIVCFLTNRLFFAARIRPKKIRDENIFDVVIDEVHQLSNTLKYVSSFVCECRKYRMGFLFICQFFSQFGSLINDVEGATAHYIMLSRSKIENYNAIAAFIEGFTLEDFNHLPKFHSMNVIATSQGRQTVVTKVPYYKTLLN